MTQDADFAAAFRESVIGWRRDEMVRVLDRGIRRGDVRPDVPRDIAGEMGQAILWHRFLITGDPITDEVVEHVVDDVLVPFVAPRAGGPPR